MADPEDRIDPGAGMAAGCIRRPDSVYNESARRRRERCAPGTKGHEVMRMIGPVVAAVLGWMAPPSAEVIELKDGHQVLGEGVAEKPGALYVDLGFDLLRIPKDAVVRRGQPSAGGQLAAAPAPAAEADASGFYTTGALRPRPVNELVQVYGEAVISIETPSGLGSGFVINDDGYAV